MLEKLAKDKHSSSLQKFVNYGQKKFCIIGHRAGAEITIPKGFMALTSGLSRHHVFLLHRGHCLRQVQVHHAAPHHSDDGQSGKI
jgi:hypothetical protein